MFVFRWDPQAANTAKEWWGSGNHPQMAQHLSFYSGYNSELPSWSFNIAMENHNFYYSI